MLRPIACLPKMRLVSFETMSELFVCFQSVVSSGLYCPGHTVELQHCKQADDNARIVASWTGKQSAIHSIAISVCMVAVLYGRIISTFSRPYSKLILERIAIALVIDLCWIAAAFWLMTDRIDFNDCICCCCTLHDKSAVQGRKTTRCKQYNGQQQLIETEMTVI